MTQMKMRVYTSFTLLLLATSTVLSAQNVLGGTSEDDCSGAGCEQTQKTTTSTVGGSSGTAPVRSAGKVTSVGTENASLGGKEAVVPQQQTLPPDVPSEFQQFVSLTTGQQLAVYGASLFRHVPSTFSPSDLVPVTSDYTVGPEDELRVRIWGGTNYSGNLRVDRSGNIYLTAVGSVHVAGLKFSELDQHLRAAVGRVYRNFDLSVDIGRIRSMQIYVTGQAQRPGVYTVSSLSTLVDALFASGGPSPQGSLRHIVLKREGKEIADFDLYALLANGDKSHDVHLLPEDVLFIPAAGAQVAITGSIRNPAIYELRGSETIADLLELAGKTSALSSNARISLERVGQDKHRQALEFALDASGTAAKLQDGDILHIYAILPNYKNTVTLRGNVANPGHFSFKPGMKLSDLIPDRDSLVTRDYWWNRNRLGVPGLEFVPAPRQATGTASVGGSSIADASNQEIPKTDVHLLSADINWGYAVIERLDPETLRTSLISFDLGKLVLQHDASQDLALQPGDTVTIFSQADIDVPRDEKTKYVKLEGEFAHPGVYSARPGETLRDLVNRAGGFSGNAYLYGSSFTRESTRALQQIRIDEYLRSLDFQMQLNAQAIANNSVSSLSGGDSTGAGANAAQTAQQALLARIAAVRATGRIVLQMRPKSVGVEAIPTIRLEDKDTFIVPSIPDTVSVVGSVFNQNAFIYQSQRTVGSYLKLAGGATRSADKKYTFILRADGSVVSRADVKGHWGDSFERLRLNPGDSIVMPEKMLRPSNAKAFLDWAQSISSMAMSGIIASKL
jgi:protein involved in polysaccharide export with SLBB domain